MIPREAGRITFTSKVPSAAIEKLVPLSRRKVEVKIIKLAGMGTIICSTIQPMNTAQDTLTTMKDSMMLIISENMGPPIFLKKSSKSSRF